MKPLLIVNPRAGGGSAGRLFDQMRAPIGRALGGFDTSFTERPRHAVDLAQAAALEGRETVVAVGGDGSIHEVVNGLMLAREKGAASTRLGIIGQGTGGDLRKSLGLTHRLDRYCAAIAEGKTQTIDVGRFSYRADDDSEKSAFFVNILSAGLGGVVDRYVAQGGRALGGTFAYFSASLRALLESEVAVLRCTVTFAEKTREIEVHTRNIAICNGRYFGSGMHVAPMARLDDGVFDVVDLGASSRLKFALQSSKIYSGKHLENPDVTHFPARKLTVEILNEGVRDKFPLDVDGEPLGRLPITVELLPGVLEVLAPG
jgi:diacylglycerol kinase (ATP)